MTLLHQAAQKAVEALNHAQQWIGSAPHGDNCYVSDHYEGDPGDRCNCGKESALSSVERALSALQHQEVPREPVAPPNSLPTWDECALRVGNSEYIAKRLAEGGYGAEPDSLLATELHRFIHEYDDADPYRSAWFLHRLELLLNEVRAAPPSTTRQREAGSGWKLAPVEPTQDMLRAGLSVHEFGWCEASEDITECGVLTEAGITQADADAINAESMTQQAEIYRAMLAAAPSTPENAGGVALPASSVSTPYQFWLIERGPNQGWPQHSWWNDSPDGWACGWKDNVHEATHYPTKEHAERVARTSRGLRLADVAVTSHSLMSAVGVPVPVSQPKAPSGTDGGPHG